MNWQEELNRNIHETHELNQYIKAAPRERELYDRVLKQFPMSVTQYYLSLIDFEDAQDPIRRMCIPSINEMDLSGTFDTSGEKENTILTGMQHKYRETVLILSTSRCAMYCRHCFRKRLVGVSDREVAEQFGDILSYIRSHEEVSNVLISGGDAFLNSNAAIRQYLEGLSGIRHLDLIRFGTRTPVVLPSRITEDAELLHILSEYNKKKQLYVVTQFNHPRELTQQAVASVRSLQKAGLIVKNQIVLLKGVNDKPKVLAELLKKLTACGVVPYYIFQCRPVAGVKKQFQVPLRTGYELVEQAKQLQNGQGKCLKYALSHVSGKIEILGKTGADGMLFKYHQAKYPKDQSRIFQMDLAENDCWLDIIPG